MIQNTDKVSNKEYKRITGLTKVPQERIDKVLELYSLGHSQNHIETELRMTRRTIRGILLKYDRIRSRTEQQTDYAHTFTTLREDAFDIVTDNMAYWLGFLYADGYITNPTGKRYLGILLKASDEPHLEKFREFLQAPQKIFHSKNSIGGKEYQTVGIHIGSRKLYIKLQEWGFTHDKSHDAKCPEVMKYNRNFWRGVIDGDGYLGIVDDKSRTRKRKRVHLCGTFDMVNSFREFIIAFRIKTNAVVGKTRNHFTFQIGDDLAKQVATLLYKDTTVYLERKYQKYLEFFNDDLEISE